MDAAHVALTILKEFKIRKLWMWIAVLTLSATGPLVATFIFSKGVAALEQTKNLDYTLLIFFIYFIVLGAEAILRIASKTRIHIYIEKIIVNIQKDFITKIPAKDKFRHETIQATRNLTQAVQKFSTHTIETGISGIVSFISVPVLLFFIDKRIFVLEIMLMAIYLTGTYLFGKHYEKQYERFDAAKEKYYSKMHYSNKLTRFGNHLIKQMRKLQDIRFAEWGSLQNLIALFKFLVIMLVAVDIFNDLKSISDLVLIVGYTTQSQKFLNSITSMIEGFMQVVAGTDRMVIAIHKAPKGSVTKIA